MSDDIVIKGTKNGLLATVGAGEWPVLKVQLLDKLVNGGDFFRGGNLVLQVGNRSLRAAELGKLRDELADLDIMLVTVLSDSVRSQNAAQALGLTIALPKADVRPLPELDASVPGEPAVLVRHTLRSGRSVHYAGGVVVLGDVNPGAEIVAGGDVIVWGKAQGILHAGADGDEAATVCALDLSPTQLRIAGLITTSPRRRGKPRPEMARIQDGQIVASAWEPASTTPKWLRR